MSANTHLHVCDVTMPHRHYDDNCNSLRFTLNKLSISENRSCRSQKRRADTNNKYTPFSSYPWGYFVLTCEGISSILLLSFKWCLNLIRNLGIPTCNIPPWTMSLRCVKLFYTRLFNSLESGTQNPTLETFACIYI